MRKVFNFILVFMIFILPTNVLAATDSVNIKVEGDLSPGNVVNIIIDYKDISNLYAASVDFTYDTSLLIINSISLGEDIKKYSDEIIEFGGEVDINGDTASYSFTFLGDKEGITGSGTLAIINAEVIGSEVLNITKDNMKVKLVKKNRDNVENYDYTFNGYSNSQSENLESTQNREEVNKSTEESNSNSINNSESSNNTSDEGNQESSKSNNLINENKKEDLNVSEGTEEVVKESTDKEKTQDNSALKDNKESNNKVNILIIVISIIVIVGSVLFYKKIYLKNKL